MAGRGPRGLWPESAEHSAPPHPGLIPEFSALRPPPPFSLALGHVAGLTMPGPAPVNPQVLGRHGGVWGPGLHPRISETMCWFSGATVKIGTTEVASHGRDSPSQSWSSDVQCHGPKIGGSEGHAPPGAAGRPFLAPCDFGWPISPTLPLLSYTRTLVTAFRATWGIQDDVLTLITSAKTRFPNEGSGTAHACGGAGEASGTECACPGGDVSTRPGLEVGAEPPQAAEGVVGKSGCPVQTLRLLLQAE